MVRFLTSLFGKAQPRDHAYSEMSGFGDPSPINPRYIGTGGMQAPTVKLNDLIKELLDGFYPPLYNMIVHTTGNEMITGGSINEN